MSIIVSCVDKITSFFVLNAAHSGPAANGFPNVYAGGAMFPPDRGFALHRRTGPANNGQEKSGNTLTQE